MLATSVKSLDRYSGPSPCRHQLTITQEFIFHALCCSYRFAEAWNSKILLSLLAQASLDWRVVQLWPPCGLLGCKNRPAPFPGRMSYKATKLGLVSVLYLSMHYTVLLFIRAPFYVPLVFVAMCSVFWLFWLSYQYLPNDWLERLLWWSLIMVRGSSPESPAEVWFSWFIVLLHCFIMYLCCLLPLCDINFFPTFMAWYSLFVLKVLLNPKKTNKTKQTLFSCDVIRELLLTSVR